MTLVAPARRSARYRFVASTETWAEANAIMELVYKAIEAREL